MKKLTLIVGALMVMAGTTVAHDGKKDCAKKEACCKKEEKTAKAETKAGCCKKDDKTAGKECHDKDMKAEKSKKEKKKRA